MHEMYLTAEIHGTVHLTLRLGNKSRDRSEYISASYTDIKELCLGMHEMYLTGETHGTVHLTLR